MGGLRRRRRQFRLLRPVCEADGGHRRVPGGDGPDLRPAAGVGQGASLRPEDDLGQAASLRTAANPRPAAGAGHEASLRHEVGEGLRYVRSQVWLWGTFLSATFTYLLFIGPTQVLLPYIVRNGLHQGASTYGAVLAAGGVGALVGALFSGYRPHPRRPMTWIYGWWTLATLAVAGYGLATSSWGLAGAAVVVNGAEAAGTVVWATLKQRRVVNSMLGRVSSIDWAISTALLPLSYALTAPVAEVLGARHALVGVGVLGAVVTAGFLFLPGMRAGDPVMAGVNTPA